MHDRQPLLEGNYDLTLTTAAKGVPSTRVGHNVRWVCQFRVETGPCQGRVLTQTYYGEELHLKQGASYVARVTQTAPDIYRVLVLSESPRKFFDDDVREELGWVSRQIELLRQEEARLKQLAHEQARLERSKGTLNALQAQGFTPTQAMYVLALVTGVCSYAIEAYDEGHIDDFDAATCLRHMLTRKEEPA